MSVLIYISELSGNKVLCTTVVYIKRLIEFNAFDITHRRQAVTLKLCRIVKRAPLIELNVVLTLLQQTTGLERTITRKIPAIVSVPHSTK